MCYEFYKDCIERHKNIAISLISDCHYDIQLVKMAFVNLLHRFK